MTHAQLHQLKDFTGLFADERFVCLLMHLQETPPRAKNTEPHGMIQDSGRMDGYLETLDRIRALQKAPQLTGAVSRTPSYQSGPTLEQKA
jgi:hypothetical protein